VVPDGRLDDALRAMAERAAEVLEANTRDMHAARADGVRDALADRLRLDDARLGAMAGQLRALADVPAEPSRRTIRDLPGGLRWPPRRPGTGCGPWPTPTAARSCTSTPAPTWAWPSS